MPMVTEASPIDRIHSPANVIGLWARVNDHKPIITETIHNTTTCITINTATDAAKYLR